MRTANRLGTALLAVALLGGGLLAAALATRAALGHPVPVLAGWYAPLTATRWGAPAVRIATGMLLAVGLLVLAAELRRWTPVRLPLPGADGWHLDRRSAQRRLAGAARQVPGVRRARARLRRGGTARVTAVGDPEVRCAVELAVRRELDRLALPPTDRLDVRLVPGRGRR